MPSLLDSLLGNVQILLILFLSVGSEYAGFLSLNTFLRDSRISTGTKYMCKEGGCGTCLVQAKLYEPITMETKSYAVNSVGCLLKSSFFEKRSILAITLFLIPSIISCL